MRKKGQAAMEFLMTYGWAILVVIAAIAALAYFGVLDPARLLPERCQSSAGMDCIDKANIGTTSVEVALRNNIGFNVIVTGASSASCTGGAAAAGTSGTYQLLNATNVTVTNNQVFKVRVDGCTGLTAGDKFDETVTVTYTNSETGLSHDVLVDVRGRVA
ncbi:hypothetical protein JXC34_06420 [Candidatus Woesearchaeota archaeon]|nr:hypothetical protein [Candidatus Woesearchaeota archaeon]